MPEEVVDPEASTPSEEEVVNPEEVQPSVQPTTVEEPTEQPVEEGQPQTVPALDETGVPWMNRAREWERKHREFTGNLENKLDELLEKRQAETAPKQYTLKDIPWLEKWAKENPEYEMKARETIEEIRLQEQAKILDEKVKVVQKEQQDGVRRQQAYSYVATNYPDCFVQNPMGGLQWNNQAPLTQLIGQIMQDKRFANDPEGIMAAADIAYGRLSRFQQGKNKSKVRTLQQSLKKVQKQTLVEGSGTRTTQIAKDEFQKLKEGLGKKKTPSKKDIEAAVGAFLKTRGVIGQDKKWHPVTE